MIRSEDSWRFGAGVVCFPSHWVPSEKLGLPITDVHEPVPHYDEELAQRVDRFLDHLAPGKNAWRRNWVIHASHNCMSHAHQLLMARSTSRSLVAERKAGSVCAPSHWRNSFHDPHSTVSFEGLSYAA